MEKKNTRNTNWWNPENSENYHMIPTDRLTDGLLMDLTDKNFEIIFIKIFK